MPTRKAIARVLLPEFVFYCLYQRPSERSDEKNLYNENMYLAEDRTLCLGIHEAGYDLSFLPDVHARVDPISTLEDLLGQRKRWVNGSNFSFLHLKEILHKK